MHIKNYYQFMVMGAFSALAVFGALQVPAASEGDTWAGTVPLGAAVALAIISVIELIIRLKTSKAQAACNPNQGTRDVVILFVIAVIYQQSFNWFGYLLPTAIVAPLALYLFGVRSPKGLMLAAVLCPLMFHLIFFKLLGVYPPYGEIFDLNEFLWSY
jgi:hypothetical protein